MATTLLNPSESVVLGGGAPHRPSATLRLTRRGRLLVLVLATALALGAFALGTGRSQAGAVEDRMPTHQVVVQPGQTLWAVATEAMPGADPREAIAEIRALNALTGSVVHPGQPLLVPAS
jgi:hypothetical protein